MKKQDFLTALGLSANEALVYRSLLKLGPASPTAIEKETCLHRPLVYQGLKNLLTKALIAAAPKGKRLLYRAQPPDAIVPLFRNLENEFIDGLEDLHQLHAEPKASHPKIIYTEGDEAVRQALMDVIESLPTGSTYYRYSPGYELFDHKRFLPKEYKTLRDLKKLERLIIVNDSKNKPRSKLGRDTRTIPRSFDLFGEKLSLIIYGDKVAIIDYDSQNVITIADPKFAAFQKKLFKFTFSKL